MPHHSLLPAVQYLCHVHGFDRQAPAADGAGDVEQATRVAGHHRIRSGVDDVVEFVVDHGRGDVPVLDRKRAAEPASRMSASSSFILFY